MRIKTSLTGLIALLVISVAFAYAQPGSTQQSDPSQASSSTSGQQSSAITKDPEMVKQVQQALKEQGYNPGPADGKWGSKSQSALKKFQEAEGMQASGQLDQQTLASLGIDSGSAAGGQSSEPAEQNGMPEEQSGAGGQSGMSEEQSGAGGQSGMSEEQSGAGGQSGMSNDMSKEQSTTGGQQSESKY